MSEISTQKPIRETVSRTIRTLRPADTDYPPMLRDIPDPPPCLYAIGDTSLLQQRALAVVGSRKCSEYGKRIAMQIGKTAAQNQVVLVSGMAKGIDSFAHLGALHAGGKTIAVLGSGVDICYPRENAKLYAEIAAKGLLLSQFPPGLQPRPQTFPQRNRIIAGLAEAVTVVEAGTNSGALITAEYAAALSREIFAVPGNITSAYSLGCNKLLMDGASPIAVIDDIFLGMGLTPAADPEETAALGQDEQFVYRMIQKQGETSIDDLCQKLQKDSVYVTGIVSVLEIKGLVAYHFGKIFIAKC